MKLKKQDSRILHAALSVVLDNDSGLWERLDDNDTERAEDLLDELAAEIDFDADEDTSFEEEEEE